MTKLVNDYLNYGLTGVKYLASHAAAVAGLLSTVGLVIAGHYPEALAAGIAALAGFGVNLAPTPSK